MAAGTIALIDDNRTWAEAAATALRDEGFEVQLAEDGSQALELLATSAPDVVILDVHLPRVSGLQVLRYLREQDSHTPVLMISSEDQAALESQAMADGATGFLHKPLPVELLVGAVYRYLQKTSSTMPHPM